jgi:hypothetical protein
VATAGDAITLAWDQLNDAGGVTWSQAYMLRALGVAQRAVVTLVPHAYAVRKNLTLTANQSVQALPAADFRLIKLIRNLGQNGSTVGKRVSLMDEAQLDRVDAHWHASAAKAEIAHYAYDKDTPRVFYVYPRPNAALQIDAIVSQMPAAPGAVGDTLALGDEYLNAIVQATLWAAWQTNSERRDVSKATAAWQAMQQLLGIKVQTDAALDPDMKAAA